MYNYYCNEEITNLFLTSELLASVSLLIHFITYLLTFAPMLYTLCTDAVGNRTLCDMCQSKTYRKQMRHREQRTAEHAEAAEHLDGTTDQSKTKIYRCPEFPCCFSFSLLFLSLSLFLYFSSLWFSLCFISRLSRYR